MSDARYRRLFSRALAAAPDRLHFAAHSHHLWPDASWLGQQAAWDDAARLADRKWDRVFDTIWPGAQRHVASELKLPDPASIVFAPNTHELLVRMVSAMKPGRIRVLASDGEFHSFRRQAARWAEAGRVTLDTVAAEPFESFDARFLAAAGTGDHDLIVISQVMFNSGFMTQALEPLAALARPEGPWLLIDGYHAFMAVESDLSAIADRAFHVAGGYKYAMAGEGVAFMHLPPGFAPRPVNTGWYAAFDALAEAQGAVSYAPDARRFLGATFDPSGLYRFVAVRDMLAREGLTTGVVSRHVAALMAKIEAGLGETVLGEADVLNPASDVGRARFLALRHRNAAKWQAALMARGVVTDVRGDVLRIGIGLYHDAKDVDALIGLAGTLRQQGLCPDF